MNQSSSRARSLPFRATRQHHGSEAAEDYTELIDDLITRTGEARTGQVAAALGISHVTAVRTLQRLQREGYVQTRRQSPVILTPKGRRTARYARERHRTLVSFLMHIGVPAAIAEVDVEGAEHHISAETLQAMRRFLKRSVQG